MQKIYVQAKGGEKNLINILMALLVNSEVGGGALTWMGFAHFDHVEASANLHAHAILAPRAPLTSDTACYLLEADAATATTTVGEKAQTPLSSSGGVVHGRSLVTRGGGCRKVTTACSPWAGT